MLPLLTDIGTTQYTRKGQTHLLPSFARLVHESLHEVLLQRLQMQVAKDVYTITTVHQRTRSDQRRKIIYRIMKVQTCCALRPQHAWPPDLYTTHSSQLALILGVVVLILDGNYYF